MHVALREGLKERRPECGVRLTPNCESIFAIPNGRLNVVSDRPLRAEAVRKGDESLCGSAGSAVGFTGGLYFHTERGSGGPHRLDERLHPEDGDHPLQIVGENVEGSSPR